MTARELYDAGRVREAAATLAAQLREDPTNTKARTFLFELLCFSGEFDRAERQLEILGSAGQEQEFAAARYRAALRAERVRHEMFRTGNLPNAKAGEQRPGRLNGKDFSSIRDQDPQINANLEVFAAGSYLWVPFHYIESVRILPARRLRERLWAPAVVSVTPDFRESEMGEVFIPAIYPFSWKLDDEAAWLGRTTDWAVDDQGHEFPAGQKIFLVDGEEVGLFEIETIDFVAAAATKGEAV